MNETIRDDIGCIGANIRRLRQECKMGPTKFAEKLQLEGVPITKEALVKIESGKQHIKLTQLRGIKDYLNVTYEDLLE